MEQIFASLGIAPIQILINLIGFLALFLLLRKFLFAPVGNVLQEREVRIAGDRDAAAASRAEMERRTAELDRRLANIEAEVRDRMQAAERDAQKAREQMLGEARAERDRLVEAGVAELHREREKMLVEIRDLVADLATGAAAKIIERELDVTAHRALIDDLVEHGIR